MLTDYIAAAMRRAKYKILDDGTYFGEIPGFRGVWANAESLAACRDDLQQALEGWLLLGLQKNARLPVVEGIRLAGGRRRSTRVA